MKKAFVLFVTLATTVIANAQLHEKIIVKAGENIGEAISSSGMYRFPKFTEGSFEMKDGTKSRAIFNYHIGNGEMMYISNKGDTMAIGAPDELVHVTIGGTTQYIYNNKAYHEILLEGPPAKLAKRVKINLQNDRKGGYGESAPASSQAQLSNFAMGSQFLSLSYDVEILKTTSFYWLDGKNNLQPATKKNTVKLVSKDKQSKLEAYIDENKTNFNNEDDLRRLLAFAGTL
jgi:hypothetical protein